MVKYALSNANRVLTVDDGLKIDAIKKLNISGNNIITIPTGYDFNKFAPKGKKEKIVLLVAAGRNFDRIKLKGVDAFVKSARFLPRTEFFVIGVHGNVYKKLKKISPPNVKLIGPIIQKDLIKYYQKAKVICQLSLREGLPNVLCEAMLCECIPVGTNVQGITTAIGDTGFYVKYNDVEGTTSAIKKALISKKGNEARKRVINMFSKQLREKRLVNVIEEIIK
jgi:glycosyltransferase involved in cell wall biosynthesis